VVLVDALSEKVVCRALGEELRRAREALGWSRGYLVARLPSGIGARTLLSYEHGTRHPTVLRFVEVCGALGVNAPSVLGVALQRARVHLEKVPVWVDLRALAADDTAVFRWMVVWAHNKLIECPGGVVQVEPSALRELATLMGSAHRDLADYLARFTPDVERIPEDDVRLRSAAG
jgi:transcriptional regulator with XRE-family HTH domain